MCSWVVSIFIPLAPMKRYKSFQEVNKTSKVRKLRSQAGMKIRSSECKACISSTFIFWAPTMIPQQCWAIFSVQSHLVNFWDSFHPQRNTPSGLIFPILGSKRRSQNTDQFYLQWLLAYDNFVSLFCTCSLFLCSAPLRWSLFF